jgi:hypothetical protein
MIRYVRHGQTHLALHPALLQSSLIEQHAVPLGRQRLSSHVLPNVNCTHPLHILSKHTPPLRRTIIRTPRRPQTTLAPGMTRPSRLLPLRIRPGTHIAQAHTARIRIIAEWIRS